MDTLRIGFMGSGFIANNLYEAMTQVRRVELSAVLKRGGAKELAERARKNGMVDCKLCDTVKEVCNNADAVAVLAPNFARVEIVEKIAEAVRSGSELRGLICEKPLGRTVSEAKKLVSKADEIGVPTAYFENQVHMQSIHNAMAQLKPQIQSMGPVSLARCTQEHSGPHSSWFWDPTRQGGGVLSDMGCHSIAVAQYLLTPPGKRVDFLDPISVTADTSLLKWGQPKYRKQLKERMGVDYSATPAEDYCTGLITYKNPETNQVIKSQFTNSWMYDKQGLRMQMDALGPGYAMEINTQNSPLEIFVSDEAAESVEDAEAGLEKATATRGLISMQPNENDLYGFPAEIADARDAFLNGKDGLMNWEYGLHITKLTQAAYLSAEKGETIYINDDRTQEKLESYTSKIAAGEGANVLYS